MKKFNLDAAKNGAKVVTRGGLAVRLFCFDLKGEGVYTICGVINQDGEEEPNIWMDRGSFIRGVSDGNDLFMATTKKPGWINIYPDMCSPTYDSELEAHNGSGERVIDTIFIEWEE